MHSSIGRLLPVLAILVVILSSGTPSIAGTAAAASGKAITTTPTAANSPWEITAAAGLNMARGNSDNLQLNINVLATYITLTDEIYLDAGYIYGENTGAVTSNAFRASANYNHLISDRVYFGLFSDFLHDELSNVDYRVDVGPNFGYYLIKNDTTKLAFEVGAGYLWEQVGVKNDYFAIRFAERFEHQLNARVKFVQSIVYQPRAEDFSDYVLTAEAGLTFAISNHWAVKAAVRDVYDSTPSAGTKSNDLAVLASISYSLGGFAEAAPAGRRTLKADKKKDAGPAMGWSNTAFLGFGLNRGNTQTLILTGDFASTYHSTTDEIFINLGGAYGEVDNTKNLENFRTSVQYNRLLTERTYVGAGLGFLYDQVAGVDYQVSPAALAGVYLVKTDKANLSVDAGPAYVWKKLGGVKSDYFAIQFGEKFSLKLAENLSFGQTLTYTADANDFSNSTVNAAAFMDMDFSSNLTFRVGVTDIYNNNPAIGSKQNDFILSSGIAIKF